MSVLKSTKDCKIFISKLIDSDLDLQGECLCHDIDIWTKDRWKRTQKRSIKTDDEVDWILNPMFPENIWLKPGTKTLVGCTMRGFLHKDGDCFVGLVTDQNNIIVAWSLQAD